MFDAVVKIFRRARLRQNMTQAELANRLHISDKAWSKIEAGANQLSFPYIKPVCEILDLPYLEVLAVAVYPEHSTQFDLRGLDVGANDKILDVDIRRPSNIPVDSKRAVMRLLADYAGRDIHDDEFMRWFSILLDMKGSK